MAAIYAAGSIALAMLERLVQRANLARTIMVLAEIPDDLPIKDVELQDGWDAPDSPQAAAAGGRWLASRRGALLRVPSAIVKLEPNYLINPAHPDAARITIGEPAAVAWDQRLFRPR